MSTLQRYRLFRSNTIGLVSERKTREKWVEKGNGENPEKENQTNERIQEQNKEQGTEREKERQRKAVWWREERYKQ